MPLYPSTGKVEERQEVHELKVSLDNITSLGQPTYREILSHKSEGDTQKDGSGVKSLYCSYRGPKFSFLHHVQWLTTSCNYSSRGSNSPSGSLRICIHVCTYYPRYTHTHNFKSSKTNQGRRDGLPVKSVCSSYMVTEFNSQHLYEATHSSLQGFQHTQMHMSTHKYTYT